MKLKIWSKKRIAGFLEFSSRNLKENILVPLEDVKFNISVAVLLNKVAIEETCALKRCQDFVMEPKKILLCRCLPKKVSFLFSLFRSKTKYNWLDVRKSWQALVSF